MSERRAGQLPKRNTSLQDLADKNHLTSQSEIVELLNRPRADKRRGVKVNRRGKGSTSDALATMPISDLHDHILNVLKAHRTLVGVEIFLDERLEKESFRTDHKVEAKQSKASRAVLSQRTVAAKFLVESLMDPRCIGVSLDAEGNKTEYKRYSTEPLPKIVETVEKWVDVSSTVKPKGRPKKKTEEDAAVEGESKAQKMVLEEVEVNPASVITIRYRLA